MTKKRKEKTVLSSTFARIVAFFLLTISCVGGLVGTRITVGLWEEDVYVRGISRMTRNVMANSVIWDDVYYVKELYQEGDITGIENYLHRRNIDVAIYKVGVPEDEQPVLLWSNYGGYVTNYSFNCFTKMKKTARVQEFIKSSETDYKYTEAKDSVATDSGYDTAYYVSEAYRDETALNMADNAESYHLQDKFIEKMEGDWAYEEHYDSTAEAEERGEYKSEEQMEVLFRVYVDGTFTYDDEYKYIYNVCMVLDEMLYVIPAVSVLALFLFVMCFVFLMCSAGHHRGQEGITGGVLYFFPFDMVTVVFGTGAALLLIGIVELLGYGGLPNILVGLFLLMVEIVWCTVYCMELAVELKKRTIFKHTLIYTILRKMGRAVRWMWSTTCSMIRGIPQVGRVLLFFGAYALVQLMVLIFFCELWSIDSEVLLLWAIEKIVLFPVVLYFALVCKKLQQGSEALAEGRLNYKLDTNKMLLGFKQHGENLNRIGEGIAVAVDERMKSEHLKTELITNVSHDLKTPLTSIINYADLIGTAVKTEVTEEGRAELVQYSEVLLRQSKRLKKLLEDLVEASKATTGNLEVHLAPCEISVILSQAVGEYMQRFAEKELVLLVKQPEEEVYIRADGRHLWRVFDNLLNNICKYAQENSRVYLTVESGAEEVKIVFRNMSKYQLEVSAEELQERFVRGDKSRHMEGNGLGLSIAGSLVELQDGKMDIVTDGDLFKVILRFPIHTEK